MSLLGKVAIITGSSTGIGAGIAECFAKEGALVSITGRNEKKLETVAKKCKEYGKDNVLTTVGDITQDYVRQKLVQQTKKTFGKIDILVNNAGMILFSTLNDVTEQHYSEQMDVNLKTPIFLTGLAAPHLIESKGSNCLPQHIHTTWERHIYIPWDDTAYHVGKNVPYVWKDLMDLDREDLFKNFGSREAQPVITYHIFNVGQGPSSGIYGITKAALDKYTKVLAQEIGPQGVRVNTLSPGYIPSDIANRGNIPKENIEASIESAIKATPIRREGTPDEIGTAAVFLASDNASFVNGSILTVDGGLRLTPPY